MLQKFDLYRWDQLCQPCCRVHRAEHFDKTRYVYETYSYVAGSESDPIDRTIKPGTTAGKILADSGLTGYLLSTGPNSNRFFAEEITIMAKRIINIDSETTVVDSGSTIRDVLDQAGIDNVLSMVGGGEVITGSDYHIRPAAPYDVPNNATPIEDVLISRLNEKKDARRDVYESLRDHQQATSENLRLLHTYLPLIIKRFYGGEVPLPALSWDLAHWRNLGWYIEKDGLALSHRINLNSLYANRPLSEVLRTLTHELGHCWQHIHGKPCRGGYHNKEFRLKMQQIGIPCNKRGVSVGIEEPFVGFLKKLGVEAEIVLFKPESQTPPDKPCPRRGSHLKPWVCKCPKAKVWASIKVELDATCHRCGSSFQRQ
jgi:hypothetical protein